MERTPIYTGDYTTAEKVGFGVSALLVSVAVTFGIAFAVVAIVGRDELGDWGTAAVVVATIAAWPASIAALARAWNARVRSRLEREAAGGEP